jgi:hypothetical protein
MGKNTMKILDNGFKKDKLDTVSFYIYRDTALYNLLKDVFFWNRKETGDSEFVSQITGDTFVFSDYNAGWIIENNVEELIDNAHYEEFIKKTIAMGMKEILITKEK